MPRPPAVPAPPPLSNPENTEEAPRLPNALRALPTQEPLLPEETPLPIARTDFEDGEPRVRDIDLAVFLGYTQPRNIRNQIARHSEALGQRFIVKRRPEAGGHEVEEQWLTKEQVNYLIVKSETPNAIALTKRILTVFQKAIDGELAPVAPVVPVAFEQMMARMLEAQAADL